MPGAMAIASIRPVSQMATAAVQLRFWPRSTPTIGWPVAGATVRAVANLKSSTVSSTSDSSAVGHIQSV